MKNYIQAGKVLDVTAGVGGITSGALVEVGDLVGVAGSTVLEGEVCPVSLEGVFEVPKVSSDVVAVGVKLYHNSGELTVTEGSNKFAGFAFAAAGNGATTVQVKLG